MVDVNLSQPNLDLHNINRAICKATDSHLWQVAARLAKSSLERNLASSSSTRSGMLRRLGVNPVPSAAIVAAMAILVDVRLLGVICNHI